MTKKKKKKLVVVRKHKKTQKVVSKKKVVPATTDPSSVVTADATTTPPPVVDDATTAATTPPLDTPVVKSKHTWRNRIFVAALIFTIGVLVAKLGGNDDNATVPVVAVTGAFTVLPGFVKASRDKDPWENLIDGIILAIAVVTGMLYMGSGGKLWENEKFRELYETRAMADAREAREDREGKPGTDYVYTKEIRDEPHR